MKLVLLSGGSGKRLWPLSNDLRSKQFLKVLEDGEGTRVSMVQRVWGQIADAGFAGSGYIATGSSQTELIRGQLGPDVPLIVEPARRDTFPAIALAAAYLYSVEKVHPDETVAVLPVDPYVEDRFFTTVASLDGVLRSTGADLALIGVKPSYPSEKYGYIVPEGDAGAEAGSDSFQVGGFREKPSEQAAEELIARGALWNCGVFAFRLDYMLNIMEAKGVSLSYEQLSANYESLESISFDYEVVERARNVAAVAYDGYWKDLGTWNTLTEEMKDSRMGRGIVSGDCVNTHLVNETDIPVTVLGLSNVVVAASPDGILVAEKGASTKLKDFIGYNQRPMYEERRWGWVRVLDDRAYDDGSVVLTKRVGIDKGQSIGYRLHQHREEVWTVVKGEGEFICNGTYMKVRAGNVMHIPMKTLHGVRATSDLEFISVQTGMKQLENSIMELYSSWEEIEQNCLRA
ncbi:sugar phosphate nucleotidyltransferase [Paenibacillus pasadenensis]|uniref:sugar phosphate nucleotidyltransferase n=1 Tax=Paenibacillus pasadenensis TaxID=217090 RepID=UPI00203B63D0|nr:sugar phosphate nucleotidyltransferase [Paenibacillus pasadenensis]MCM3748260.1 sugar phosphate nucleotidyltransferase [Paenibacillus pasadenensis]